MGMFQTYVFKSECPKCKTPVNNFQSKAFGDDICECINVGENIEKSFAIKETDYCFMQKGWAIAYTSCPNKDCDVWINAKANIENNIFISITDIAIKGENK